MNYPKTRYTGPKPWMDYDWLYNEYVVKDRNSKDIANEYHCKQNTIQCWLLRHGIKKDLSKCYSKYDYLYENYVMLHKSRQQIAEENHVCVETIAEYLRQYKIPIWDRVPNPYRKLSEEDIPDIVTRYTVDGESSVMIAKDYGVRHRTILNVLKKMDMKMIP